MRPLALILLAGALAASLPAAAQVYRWTDARGVVNYGNKPPDGAAGLTRLAPEDSRISIVSTPSRARVAPAPEAPLSADFPSAVDRRTVAAVADGWRERCFAERRVDCTAPTAATYDYTPAYAPSPVFAGAPVLPARVP